MRVVRLFNGFEVRVAGEGPSAIVAEVWHVAPEARDAPPGTGSRLVAHLAASPRPPEPTQPGTPAYWRADVFFRHAVPTELRDPGLTRAIAEWFLSDTTASKPLLVQFHDATDTHFDMRGGILDNG